MTDRLYNYDDAPSIGLFLYDVIPSPTFPIFDKLPSEIRDIVWSRALSDHVQILFITKRGERQPQNYPGLIARACREAWAQAARGSIFHIGFGGASLQSHRSATFPELCRPIRRLLVDRFWDVHWERVTALRDPSGFSALQVVYVARNVRTFRVVAERWPAVDHLVLGSVPEAGRGYDGRRPRQILDMGRADGVELVEHVASSLKRRVWDRKGPIMARWRREDQRLIRNLLDHTRPTIATLGSYPDPESARSCGTEEAMERRRVPDFVPVVWATHDSSCHLTYWLSQPRSVTLLGLTFASICLLLGFCHLVTLIGSS